MKSKIHIKTTFLFLLLAIGYLTACHSTHPAQPEAGTSPYCEDSAMAHFLTEPDRAIAMLDSSVIVHTLTPQRAAYLKAIVLYNGKNETNEAIRQCQQLIDDESWEQLPDSEDVVSFQVDLYRLMATLASGQPLTVLKYAREGARLSHGIEKLRGDEADLFSRTGFVLCQMGDYDEGINDLLHAEQLALTDDTWSSLLAYLNTAKKLHSVLSESGRYDEAADVTRLALQHLSSLRKHISEVRNAPEAMATDSLALEEFIQYYQACYHSHLANIFAAKQQFDSVQYYLDRIAENPQSKNPDFAASAVYPLITVGSYDEAEHRLSMAKEMFEGEPLGIEYLSLLKNERLLLQQTGRQKESDLLADEIIAITDSLNTQKIHITLADAATQYQLQEEKLLREDSESKLLILMVFLILSLLVIFSLVAGIFIHRLDVRRKATDAKLAEANAMIKNLKETQKSSAEEKTRAISLDEIYKRINIVMEHYEQYTNADFDINSLSQLVFSNRSYVSQAINQKTGMNFRTWLAQKRIEHAQRLMSEHPDTPIEEVMIRCGIENRSNFYRQFKEVTGVTPKEWTDQQSEQTNVPED